MGTAGISILIGLLTILAADSKGDVGIDEEAVAGVRGDLSNCCEIGQQPGCDDPACEALVCAEFPACCDVAWGWEKPFPPSAACVDLAVELCDGLCDGIVDGCGGPDTGSCCETSDTPFCDEQSDCCESICLGDPNDPLNPPDSWCCLVEWDQLCVNQAINNPMCDCDVGPGDCCEDNEYSPGCLDPVCEECVCLLEPLCCSLAWLPFCVDAAEFACADVCGCDVKIPDCPDSDNDCCFAGFDEPGCADLECCNLVCGSDPFCCDTAWDFVCAEAANEICPICGGGSCEGDANGDGLVDPLDSGFVLARFGCPVGTGDPNCDIADQNGDGLVDPLDVGFILARFGDCP